MKKLLHTFILFFIILFPVLSFAQSSDRTIIDIVNKWNQLKPVFYGNPYQVVPSTNSPYSSGKLKGAALNDALNYVNFIRWLANLNTVKLKDQYNKLAQYASVLLCASEFSHFPPKPKDMSKEFYDIALEGTSSSNIGSGFYDLPSSIYAYMDDSDPDNISAVGHRRWILSPYMSYIGFGYAFKNTATYVFDRDYQIVFNKEYISWPTEGFFPIELFNKNIAFSVSLNPEVFKKVDPKKVKVYITRVSDNKTWVLDEKYSNISYNIRSYFAYSSINYGYFPALIFRPDINEEIKENDIFNIKITGLNVDEKREKTIEYSIFFFSLNKIKKVELSNVSVNTHNISIPLNNTKRIEQYINIKNKHQYLLKSTDKNIIKIMNNNTIKANKPGVAYIYFVEPKTNNILEKIQVSVYNPYTDFSAVTPTVYMYNESYNIFSNIKTNENYNRSIFDIKVSDPEIAIIDENGFIKPKKAGKVTITIENLYTKKMVSFNVIIVPDIEIPEGGMSIDIKEGQSYTVNVKSKPPVPNDMFEWIIHNPEIASVDKNGKVTGLKIGITYLEAKLKYQDRTIIYLVNVYSR